MEREATVDPRVRGVLRVLAGTPVPEAAEALGVEPALLERWRDAFVRAGVAAVCNTPGADESAARDRFLAAMAHELRTPLTTLKGWLPMLVDGHHGPERTAQAGEIAQRGLERLEGVVATIEEAAAASLGRLVLRRRRVPASALLADVAATTGGARDVEVEVDPERMRTALADVIDAATRADGTASLRAIVRETPPWLVVEIERTGVPLPPNHVRALFEPFADREGHMDVTFGLYRARALVVAHGGQIGVRSSPDGDVFWVRLPLPPDIPHDPNDKDST